MQQSETIAQLTKALAELQADLRNPPCDKANTHFGQRYATLASIIDTIRPAMAKHGLSIVQGLHSEPAVIRVTTTLYHASGEWISATVSWGVTGNIQQLGSAITYLRRYSLAALVGIVGDEDDDAEAVISPTRSSQGKRRAAPPAGDVAPKAPVEAAAAPAGFERFTPTGCVERTTRGESPKPFWEFTLEPGNLTASTFSSTIAATLQAGIGKPFDMAIREKSSGGRVWLNIIEIL